MARFVTRRDLIRQSAGLGVALCLPYLPVGRLTRPAHASGPRAEEQHASAHPTELNRPVCPAGSEPEQASFIDPTAIIVHPEHIALARHVYDRPFRSAPGR